MWRRKAVSTARPGGSREEPHDDLKDPTFGAHAINATNSKATRNVRPMPLRGGESEGIYCRPRMPFPCSASRTRRSLHTSIPMRSWPT